MSRPDPKKIRGEIGAALREDLAHERPIVCNCTRCRCPDARIYPAAVAERLFPGPDAFKGCCLCPACSFREPISVAQLEWIARGEHVAGCPECRSAVARLGIAPAMGRASA